jgi:hypothetical protein
MGRRLSGEVLAAAVLLLLVLPHPWLGDAAKSSGNDGSFFSASPSFFSSRCGGGGRGEKH